MAVDLAVEGGSHPVESDDDVLARRMGTGYRGVIDKLSPLWKRVWETYRPRCVRPGEGHPG